MPGPIFEITAQRVECAQLTPKLPPLLAYWEGKRGVRFVLLSAAATARPWTWFPPPRAYRHSPYRCSDRRAAHGTRKESPDGEAALSPCIERRRP
jgi:hypothetical protein